MLSESRYPSTGSSVTPRKTVIILWYSRSRTEFYFRGLILNASSCTQFHTYVWIIYIFIMFRNFLWK